MSAIAQSSNIPADACTRGLSTSALADINWLKGPDFLRTPQCLFEPSEVFLWKFGKPKQESSLLPETESPTTMVTATQCPNAQTFEWQKNLLI